MQNNNIMSTQEYRAKYEIEYFAKQKSLQNIKNYYCVVTAAYNAENYLDAYFKSLCEQSLDFQKYIYILIVDDGSTDNSLEIIKKWKKKFRFNISYISCKNGGQSRARNIALKYVKAPWITFIDADDTVNNIYFKEVNSFLAKNKNIDMVSCNQIFYMQESAKEKKHFLSYRFKNKQTVVNPTHMQGFIQCTASSVFFKLKDITKYNLEFKEDIKPVFEDGYFVNTLFIKEPSMNIAFLNKPTYYYTKREDKSSTVDTSWQNAGRYDNSLKFAILNLLQKNNALYIQRYALYQVYWYFKKIVNNPEVLNFLDEKQIKSFKEILKEIFLYIDSQNIEVCGLGGLWHKYRIGFYKLYKENILFKQVCYIDAYDNDKKELKLHYYFHSQNKEIFLLNNNEISDYKYEIIEHKFLDEVFVYEKVISLALLGKWEYLDVIICDIETQISLNKKRYLNGISLSEFM